MKASEILARAKALADLGDTKFIDHDFALASINEAWGDVYSALVDSDDDYYVTETTLTLNSGTAVAGAQNEHLVALPTGALKVRYLDWQGTQDWCPVGKFSIGMKDSQPGVPYYRLRGANLWIIGASVPTGGLSLRLGYYPAASEITAPADPLEFTTSYARANLALVTYPGYTDYNRTGVYSYNGTGLKAESIDRGTTATPVALFTESDAASSLTYYKGYLYWVRQANIYSKATDLTAAFTVPTAVTSSNDVVDFQIYNNTIYFITSTAVKTCSLTGTGTATLGSGLTCTRGAALLGGVVYYVDTTTVKSVTPAATLKTGCTDVTSDGTYLYVKTTDYKVQRLTLVAGAITATDELHADCLSMGPYQGGLLPIIQNAAQTMVALDPAVDYDFSFPNNLVPEIMAYRCAIDYRIRQSADPSGLLARLGHRSGDEGPATGLWARFEKLLRRDEYQPERIRNANPSGGWSR